jgi:hypothetical protein
MHKARFGLGLFSVLFAACAAEPDGQDWENEPLGTLEEAVTIPSDPLFVDQWALLNTGQVVPWTSNEGEVILLPGVPGIDINVTKAWDITQGSSAVKVGIAEISDVDITHEDLVDQIFVNGAEVPNDGRDNDENGCIDDVRGCDFTNGDGMNDFGGHATHVSAIVAARMHNGKGMAGVAPKIKLIPLTSQANQDSFIRAIEYAKKMGIRIINCSQGGYEPEWNVPAVADAMRNSNILFVCSGGNRGTPRFNYPSSYPIPNLLSVANVDNSGELSEHSSYGAPHVDIAAPGRAVLSAELGNDYANRNGTSQAAPHVAGVAALVMNKFPALTAEQVAERLVRTAARLPSLAGMVRANGMVDAHAALTDVSPIALSARSEAGRVILSWTAQRGATRYELERDGAIFNAGLSRSHTHAGLTVDSNHVYRVRAVTAGGTQPFSHRFIIRASAPPLEQAFVRQTAHPYPNDFSQAYPVEIRNAKRIRLHFTRLETQPGDELMYGKSFTDDDQVDEALSGNYPSGFWTHWFEGNFQFEFDSDAAGTAYGFATDKVQYVVGIPDQPSMPFFFDSSGGSISFGISSTAATLTVYVYRSTSANSGYSRIATLPANASDFTDSGLVIGRRYFYKVGCANDLGESPLSPYLEVVAQ